MKEKEMILGLVFAFAGILIGFGGYNLWVNLQGQYAYETEISNIPVYSQIPLEDLQKWERIALFRNDNKGATTCNFEIAAISIPDKKGYRVNIKKGPESLYIRRKSAEIRGSNEEEILDSCHVFACLLSGVKCPENFQELRRKIPQENRMNLVLDTRLGSNGIRAYTEILGVLGFIQAKLVDIDKDKKFSDAEKLMNKVFIYPYMKNGSECGLQPFKNLVQGMIESNESINCDEISSGIFILKSEDEGVKNEITVKNNKILLLGDENTIYKEAIILRDIISPKWIRTVYGLS
jgi:hypothetical protein